MKTFIMLAGVPGCGKSTLIKKILEFIPNAAILSTDDFIQAAALLSNRTYDEAFFETIKEAEKYLNIDLQNAISHDRPIIWDQTNISVKTRQKKLAKIPETYWKIAVWFKTPDEDEWMRRLNSRPGKTIPKNILYSMAKQFVIPTIEEGFDSVLDSDNFLDYM